MQIKAANSRTLPAGSGTLPPVNRRSSHDGNFSFFKAGGILLNVSAGNAYSSSWGGANGDYASTSDPDTGIVGSPSSYDASLTVASVNTAASAAFRTEAGHVPYNDVSGHDFTALLSAAAAVLLRKKRNS